jgi:hypothetical protein
MLARGPVKATELSTQRVHTTLRPCFVMHALRRPWAPEAAHSHSCREADHSEAEASSFGTGQRAKLEFKRHKFKVSQKGLPIS